MQKVIAEPVYTGDLLTYTTSISNKRVVRSRPSLGLVFFENAAINQQGERVLEFSGALFWERRSP
ncbi:hypothetical protein [Rhizobium sp. BR 362]|uniref:hypothetical protein n=1 Tax=Rhizobium sp. BR 362 TaxID=3040670 RepID=UPI002F41CD29